MNPLAFLDFYQVHYYKNQGIEVNPAVHKITDFIADGKQVLIGEIAVRIPPMVDCTAKPLAAHLVTIAMHL